MNTPQYPEAAETVQTKEIPAVAQERLVVPLRRRSPMLGLLALSALAMMPGMGGGPLAADIRNDPDREKTDEDLKRMDAAKRKRERKAALSSRHNTKRKISHEQ